MMRDKIVFIFHVGINGKCALTYLLKRIFSKLGRKEIVLHISKCVLKNNNSQ